MSGRGRIWFPGNPWPDGHAVAEAELSGLLTSSGVRLLLHLQSAEYCAERDVPDDETIEGDWQAPIVWNNYHRCTMSQTHWGWNEQSGFPATAPGQAFDATALAGLSVHLDPASEGDRLDDREPNDRAFHIYLLGHDACGDHRIAFSAGGAPGAYDIDWTGRIALAYAGDDVFRYSFLARLEGVAFGGLIVPRDTDLAEARARLAAFTVQPERYKATEATVAARFIPWA